MRDHPHCIFHTFPIFFFSIFIKYNWSIRELTIGTLDFKNIHPSKSDLLSYQINLFALYYYYPSHFKIKFSWRILVCSCTEGEWKTKCITTSFQKHSQLFFGIRSLTSPNENLLDFYSLTWTSTIYCRNGATSSLTTAVCFWKKWLEGRKAEKVEGMVAEED